MNIALILSGGKGERMGEDIPKQFLKVNDCPIIVYTLLKMQNHPKIDKIQAVCVAGFENTLLNYAKQYDISKLNKVVTGGKTRYESTRIGMESLNAAADDIIVAHDSVRPLVPEKVISEVIEVCKVYGNSMSVLNCTDTIYEKTASDYTAKERDRAKLVRGQTPEAVTGKRMKEMYAASDKKNIRLDSISALQTALGYKVHFAEGSELNIKITRPEDMIICKSFLSIV